MNFIRLLKNESHKIIKCKRREMHRMRILIHIPQLTEDSGPVVRVALVSEWGDPVNVEITHERFRELDLHKDKKVFLRPKERRVFVNAEDNVQ
jgi:hypothetical protein